MIEDPNIETFNCIFRVTPMGKPRMTRQDKFKKRPCVTKYRGWKDQINLMANLVAGLRAALSEERIYSVSWIAYLPLPKSKDQNLAGTMHQEKPDRDNIDKALLDALLQNDEGVALGSTQKFWDDGNGPRLEVEFLATK